MWGLMRSRPQATASRLHILMVKMEGRGLSAREKGGLGDASDTASTGYSVLITQVPFPPVSLFRSRYY